MTHIKIIIKNNMYSMSMIKKNKHLNMFMNFNEARPAGYRFSDKITYSCGAEKCCHMILKNAKFENDKICIL